MQWLTRSPDTREIPSSSLGIVIFFASLFPTIRFPVRLFFSLSTMLEVLFIPGLFLLSGVLDTLCTQQLVYQGVSSSVCCLRPA